MEETKMIQVLYVADKSETSEMVLPTAPGISFVAHNCDSDALKHLEEADCSVVVLALPPAGGTAIELTRRIRQAHPQIKVVISTVSDSPDDIFAAMDAGADGYVLHENANGLEMAIRSVRLNSVWLDPAIAKQVLDLIVSPRKSASARELPTGLLPMPLLPSEKELLSEVAACNCADGVCMVDAGFIKKLRRFAPSARQ